MTLERHESAIGSLGPLARELSSEIEAAILRLVVDGFHRWREGGYRRIGNHEDHYTVRLVACMREIRRERNLAIVPRYQHVEPSAAMLEGIEDPVHAGRIDLTVWWDFLIEDAFFSVECKRLAPNQLARLYVVDGIDRFVRGYYGAKARTGAMVGYVISGTPCTAFDRVNGEVEEAQALDSTHKLSPVNPIGWLTDVFTSNHQRTTPLQPIRLTHLFFDMTEIPES